MVVDALKDGAAVGGDAGDETCLVAITAGDVEEGKQVAIGSEAGEGGVVAVGVVAFKLKSGKGLLLTEVEEGALPAVAQHHGITFMESQSLGTAMKVDGLGEPLGKRLHHRLLGCDEHG